MSDDSPTWQRKLDHRLRMLLATPEQQHPLQRVSVLVRIDGSLKALQHLGLQVRSSAGDIASATVALADLEAIAARPEVTFIELAQPLAPDASPSR